eukprot:c20763_g14_i1.p1 GENE.c20763_g14_i1~~c20763_g14_i1.p1  ORF type:complete len:178 (+),score=29.00 c20763_g14_i1:37-534(+)
MADGLWTFVQHGKEEQLLKELRKNPTLATTFHQGCTLVHIAASYGQPEIIKLLRKFGADVNAPRLMDQRSGLAIAAEYGYPEVIETLVNFGADINSQDANGNTPLFLAANFGQIECARELLDYGARVDVPNAVRNSRTKIHIIPVMYLSWLLSQLIFFERSKPWK